GSNGQNGKFVASWADRRVCSGDFVAKSVGIDALGVIEEKRHRTTWRRCVLPRADLLERRLDQRAKVHIEEVAVLGIGTDKFITPSVDIDDLGKPLLHVIGGLRALIQFLLDFRIYGG